MRVAGVAGRRESASAGFYPVMLIVVSEITVTIIIGQYRRSSAKKQNITSARCGGFLHTEKVGGQKALLDPPLLKVGVKGPP